jgi:signal transduction histidine kinase
MSERLNDELTTAAEHFRESERHQAFPSEELAERYGLLQATQEQWLRAERLAALGQFATIMAHELRNPLNVIRLSAHCIGAQLPAEDERLQRHLGHLNEAVSRACAIIDDLLAFSELSPPSLQIVAVNDLVRKAIDALDVPGRVTIDWALTAEIPFVLADLHQIERAIGNLGLNALQAMPEGGRLTIATRLAEDQVEIILRDTGPGIPEELRERVAEPFFSTKVIGTGLGLSLVRGIVAAHRGQLYLDSSPGEGAAFTLSLPVADSPGAGTPTAGPEPWSGDPAA